MEVSAPEELPALKPNEPLTARPAKPSYARGLKKSVDNERDVVDGEESEAHSPQAPKVPDLPPPECLTDGSNSQIPRDYIAKWRINDGNVEQRLKELKYTVNLLTNKDIDELVSSPGAYERDF